MTYYPNQLIFIQIQKLMVISSLRVICMSSIASIIFSHFYFDLSELESYLAWLFLLALLYFLYHSVFSKYSYSYVPINPGNIYRGKTPPAYPNGWFVISKSSDLKKGQVTAKAISGIDLVLFRGEDNVAYILDAFCPHSGANLGHGGVVKHGTCVQCPFHGWLFDGNTGNLVAGANLKPKTVDFFEYTSEIGKCNADPNEVLKKTGAGKVSLRKYLVKEISGFIYVWLHADPQCLPNYEPLDFSEYIQDLTWRGTSINKIHTHAQDIVENGGDIRHFVYVHSLLLPFTKLLKLEWEAKWLQGNDPDLRKSMKHSLPWVNDIKNKLFDQYLDKPGSENIGVMNLTLNISLSNVMSFFFFNATIFQVGPGLVYLFLASPFYKALYFQHTLTHAKFDHDVFHELYISWHVPFWTSAAMLRLEALQVTNDTLIWNRKVFADKPYYNTSSEADLTIIRWRKWFAQFYQGCKEKEQEMEKYQW